MIERVVIVGAGYCGEALAQRALEAGLEVVVTARDVSRLAPLVARGARALALDVTALDAAALAPVLGPTAALIYSVPTLYQSVEPAPEGQLPHHVQPLEATLAVAREAGLGRLIYLSSTSVYGDHEGRWVDEETPLAPLSALGEMRRDLEAHALKQAPVLPVSIARLVGIYGPGRTLVEAIERGRYRVVGEGDKVTNRVHVEDIVSALMAMIAQHASPGEPGEVYNVSDGSPVTVRALLDFLGREYGIVGPAATSLEEVAARQGANVAARWEAQYRCDNRKMREVLGVTPRYEDVFAGYGAILGAP